MYNKTINIGVVAKVAEGLQQYREQVVFVGGLLSVIIQMTQQTKYPKILILPTINVVDIGVFHKTIKELDTIGFQPILSEPLFMITHTKISGDIIPAG